MQIAAQELAVDDAQAADAGGQRKQVEGVAKIEAIVGSERAGMGRALPVLRAAVAEVRGLKRHDFEALCGVARKAACPQIVQGLLVALQPLLLPEANLIEEGSATKAAAASHPQAPYLLWRCFSYCYCLLLLPTLTAAASHPQAPLGADARALTKQRVACLAAALEAAPEKRTHS